jgi:nicotinamide-nucleotide amidase
MTTPGGTFSPVSPAAANLADCLESRRCLIVFAESCTAGLASARLAQRPGISAWHCGSAVVYQLETKTAWLNVTPAILIDPGPVSEVVAEAMARGVLRSTPQAEFSAAITGHLGPGAPAEQDGLIWMAVANRAGTVVTRSVWLTKEAVPPVSLRLTRQDAAAEALLDFAREVIERE